MFFQDSTICVFGPIHSSHLWAAWEPGSQRGHLGVDPVKRFAVTVKEQDEGIFHGYNGGGIIMYIYIYNPNQQPLDNKKSWIQPIYPNNWIVNFLI